MHYCQWLLLLVVKRELDTLSSERISLTEKSDTSLGSCQKCRVLSQKCWINYALWCLVQLRYSCWDLLIRRMLPDLIRLGTYCLRLGTHHHHHIRHRSCRIHWEKGRLSWYRWLLGLCCLEILLQRLTRNALDWELLGNFIGTIKIADLIGICKSLNLMHHLVNFGIGDDAVCISDLRGNFLKLSKWSIREVGNFILRFWENQCVFFLNLGFLRVCEGWFFVCVFNRNIRLLLIQIWRKRDLGGLNIANHILMNFLLVI
jgi:hypothetical protein